MASLGRIAAGGAAGTLARWGVLEIAGDPRATAAVVGINLIGSALIGILAGLRPRDRRHNAPWHYVALGFCGGFTTFATFSVDVAQRLRDGHIIEGVGLSAVTVVGALAAAIAGRALSIRREAAR